MFDDFEREAGEGHLSDQVFSKAFILLTERFVEVHVAFGDLIERWVAAAGNIKQSYRERIQCGDQIVSFLLDVVLHALKVERKELMELSNEWLKCVLNIFLIRKGLREVFERIIRSRTVPLSCRIATLQMVAHAMNEQGSLDGPSQVFDFNEHYIHASFECPKKSLDNGYSWCSWICIRDGGDSGIFRNILSLRKKLNERNRKSDEVPEDCGVQIYIETRQIFVRSLPLSEDSVLKVFPGANLVVHRWYFMVVTHSCKGSYCLYLNGEPISEIALAYPFYEATLTTSSELDPFVATIGSFSGQTGRFSLYGSLLSKEDVRSLFELGPGEFSIPSLRFGKQGNCTHVFRAPALRYSQEDRIKGVREKRVQARVLFCFDPSSVPKDMCLRNDSQIAPQFRDSSGSDAKCDHPENSVKILSTCCGNLQNSLWESGGCLLLFHTFSPYWMGPTLIGSEGVLFAEGIFNTLYCALRNNPLLRQQFLDFGIFSFKQLVLCRIDAESISLTSLSVIEKIFKDIVAADSTKDKAYTKEFLSSVLLDFAYWRGSCVEVQLHLLSFVKEFLSQPDNSNLFATPNIIRRLIDAVLLTCYGTLFSSLIDKAFKSTMPVEPRSLANPNLDENLNRYPPISAAERAVNNDMNPVVKKPDEIIIVCKQLIDCIALIARGTRLKTEGHQRDIEYLFFIVSEIRKASEMPVLINVVSLLVELVANLQSKFEETKDQMFNFFCNNTKALYLLLSFFHESTGLVCSVNYAKDSAYPNLLNLTMRIVVNYTHELGRISDNDEIIRQRYENIKELVDAFEALGKFPRIPALQHGLVLLITGSAYEERMPPSRELVESNDERDIISRMKSNIGRMSKEYLRNYLFVPLLLEQISPLTQVVTSLESVQEGLEDDLFALLGLLRAKNDNIRIFVEVRQWQLLLIRHFKLGARSARGKNVNKVVLSIITTVLSYWLARPFSREEEQKIKRKHSVDMVAETLVHLENQMHNRGLECWIVQLHLLSACFLANRCVFASHGDTSRFFSATSLDNFHAEMSTIPLAEPMTLDERSWKATMMELLELMKNFMFAPSLSPFQQFYTEDCKRRDESEQVASENQPTDSSFLSQSILEINDPLSKSQDTSLFSAPSAKPSDFVALTKSDTSKVFPELINYLLETDELPLSDVDCRQLVFSYILLLLSRVFPRSDCAYLRTQLSEAILHVLVERLWGDQDAGRLEISKCRFSAIVMLVLARLEKELLPADKDGAQLSKDMLIHIYCYWKLAIKNSDIFDPRWPPNSKLSAAQAGKPVKFDSLKDSKERIYKEACDFLNANKAKLKALLHDWNALNVKSYSSWSIYTETTLKTNLRKADEQNAKRQQSLLHFFSSVNAPEFSMNFYRDYVYEGLRIIVRPTKEQEQQLESVQADLKSFNNDHSLSRESKVVQSKLLADPQLPLVEFWKLYPVESQSRTRCFLKKNFFSGSDHATASNFATVAKERKDLESALLKLSASEVEDAKADEIPEDSPEGDESMDSIPNKEENGKLSFPYKEENKKNQNLFKREKIMLVTPLRRYIGTLALTTDSFISFDGVEDNKAGESELYQNSQQHLPREKHFKRKVSSLKRAYARMFLLQQHALELETDCGRFYFFVILEVSTKTKLHKERNRLLELICKLTHTKYEESPAQEVKVSRITERWQKWEISNFDYLMYLNTLAGRSYNDLSQYPVFPWVLKDYSSKTLNLNDESIYRDLSLPVGALNSERWKTFQDRYQSMIEDSEPNPFHFGSHYSSEGISIYYLLRMEPFTRLAINLQGGKFDHADRLFTSIAGAWNMSLNNVSDVKELVPEFFYMPEFLTNMNRIRFGVHQSDNTQVDDVKLPPWARTPGEFIQIHRQSLESDHVSANIHKWIDLIFGFKQRGPEAVTAKNMFYYLTYPGAVNLDKISDLRLRAAIIDQIAHFGSCPMQLFTLPHPKRDPRGYNCLGPLSIPASLKSYHLPSLLYRYGEQVSGNIFQTLKSTKGLVVPKTLFYLKSEQVLSVHAEGLITCHNLRHFVESDQNKYCYANTTNATTAGEKKEDNPQDSSISDTSFEEIGLEHKNNAASSAEAIRVVCPHLLMNDDSIFEPFVSVLFRDEFLFSGGYRDRSLKLHQVLLHPEPFHVGCRPLASLVAHAGIISALALNTSKGATVLVSGCSAGTINVWSVATLEDTIPLKRSKPSKSFSVHTGKVLSIVIDNRSDILVSLAMNSRATRGCQAGIFSLTRQKVENIFNSHDCYPLVLLVYIFTQCFRTINFNTSPDLFSSSISSLSSSHDSFSSSQKKLGGIKNEEGASWNNPRWNREADVGVDMKLLALTSSGNIVLFGVEGGYNYLFQYTPNGGFINKIDVGEILNVILVAPTQRHVGEEKESFGRSHVQGFIVTGGQMNRVVFRDEGSLEVIQVFYCDSRIPFSSFVIDGNRSSGGDCSIVSMTFSPAEDRLIVACCVGQNKGKLLFLPLPRSLAASVTRVDRVASIFLANMEDAGSNAVDAFNLVKGKIGENLPADFVGKASKAKNKLSIALLGRVFWHRTKQN